MLQPLPVGCGLHSVLQSHETHVSSSNPKFANPRLNLFSCIIRMLTENQIWDTAKSVWYGLPSSKNASGLFRLIGSRIIG